MTMIRIAAALLVDAGGRMLLVRKRGTTRFMQAGGKIDPGESALQAVVRELDEEVGLILQPGGLEYLGRFGAAAANEPGHRVDAEVYFAEIAVAVTAASEIEELVWVSPADAVHLSLAPLTRDILLPLLAERGRQTQP